VRNGTVSGMWSDGIRVAGTAEVENVQAVGNGGSGILADGGVYVIRNDLTTSNGRYGIQVNIEGTVDHCVSVGNHASGLLLKSGVATGNTLSRNGDLGARFGDIILLSSNVSFSDNTFTSNVNGSLAGGRATGGNSCDDSRCTRTGARRYYLSADTKDGANARSACGSGFHMASIWEIKDTTALVYDASLGLSLGDSGSGPPTNKGTAGGWIRTGAQQLNAAADPGGANCNGYASSLGFGTVVAPAAVWDDGLVRLLAPWDVASPPCSALRNVWCVED
jgi:hypothetical protein